MIALEEVPGSGFIHDASTLIWVPLNGVEEYLDSNYVIIDDPSQVEVFEKLQKETKRTVHFRRKAGTAALLFEILQFLVPVLILVGIYIISIFPPFHQSIGPFDLPTAVLINNVAVVGIAGIGGSYALVQVFRRVDFHSVPVLAYAGLVVGLTCLGLIVFRLLVI